MVSYKENYRRILIVEEGYTEEQAEEEIKGKVFPQSFREPKYTMDQVLMALSDTSGGSYETTSEDPSEDNNKPFPELKNEKKEILVLFTVLTIIFVMIDKWG